MVKKIAKSLIREPKGFLDYLCSLGLIISLFLEDCSKYDSCGLSIGCSKFILVDIIFKTCMSTRRVKVLRPSVMNLYAPAYLI